jgi:uncharacterized protein YndB with AHSA1/START domain
MSQSSVTTGSSYRQRLSFTQPPDVVYRAIATPAGVSGWWMPTTGSGAEGGRLHISFPPGVGVFGVDTAQRASRVGWSVEELAFLPDWIGTRIVFELAPGPTGGTELDFHHDGLTPQLECYDQCRQGWDHYLPSLHDYVETGAGHPGDRHAAR